MTKSCLAITFLCLYTQQAHSWSQPQPNQQHPILSSDEPNNTNPTITTTNRRNVLRRTITSSFAILTGATTSPLLLPPTPAALAATASTVPSPKDLSRLQRGHARVRYLLENWDALTQICDRGVMSDVERKQTIRTQGGGGGVCEKTPLRVQDFLGYKSTEDPLFKVDKLMLKAAPLVDPDEFENYLSTVESYREKADQGSMMAYTSSWGEANPNGGQDVIEEYLEKTKDEVVATEKLLRKIMGYLELEVLPPSASK